MGRKVSSRWRRGNLTIAPLPRPSLHLTLSEDRAKRFTICDNGLRLGFVCKSRTKAVMNGDPELPSTASLLLSRRWRSLLRPEPPQ